MGVNGLIHILSKINRMFFLPGWDTLASNCQYMYICYTQVMFVFIHFCL